MSEKLALVLGATGGAGGEIAAALKKRGWAVRAMGRDATSAAQKLPQFDWVQGDAMNRADVLAAAQGARVIVHAVNPAGYRNWAGTVLPMIDNTIVAAKAQGARVVLPGTLYNYGPDAFPIIAEDAPQNPRTKKGKIRVTLERRLEAASAQGMRALILRAGDFFGPHGTPNTWFAQMVKPGAPVNAILYPGDGAAGHAWAYLPDLAETVAQLLERESDLAPFERFHFNGHSVARGMDFAEALQAFAGGAPIKRFPWLMVSLVSPFVETLREVMELKYLWREDVRLDNSKLVRFLGAEPHTALPHALRATLEGQGSLPAVSAPQSALAHAH